MCEISAAEHFSYLYLHYYENRPGMHRATLQFPFGGSPPGCHKPKLCTLSESSNQSRSYNKAKTVSKLCPDQKGSNSQWPLAIGVKKLKTKNIYLKKVNK